MKLCEHPDFEQAILQAADHFRDRGLRPSLIEKDYYVTEALRIVAAMQGDRAIFKGGTSLSKGWNLIQRFSEDIDLFLDPQDLGPRAIDRELKRLRDAIATHPALTLEREEGQTVGGFGRSDRFSYRKRFGAVGDVANRVLVEAGTASGREPTVQVDLRSLIGEFLQDRGTSLGASDETPFPMRLLHFRRTFVEKMFAIHSKVELYRRDQRPLGSYARHYYDLYQLGARQEVLDMLQSDEYQSIRTDYDRVSRSHFSRSYFFPKDMRFSNSDALFPPAELEPIIRAEYESQCQLLCYGRPPTWDQVQARFEQLRPLL